MGNNTTGLDQGRVVDSLQNLYEEAYVDGQNAPNGYSCNKKRDDAVAAAMVSACEPGHAIAGRVILNAEGVKAISFGDEQWASLQVGDVIYSAGMGVGLGHGDPVGEVVAFGKGLHEIAWAAGRMPKLGAKLYTHADPGEVERLAILLRQTQVKHSQERDTLRAQLAERVALLREVIDGKTRTQFDGNLMHRILMVLSASAEPSAPVERPVISGTALAEITTIIDEAFVAGQNGPYYAEDCINWVDRILEQVGKRRDD
ncbi:hypothetical protein DDSR119_48 [Pseudomonas phage DDSR119]|nr:hypothetical protein DDSR119_48 [Pseudomonas phage DDSR119]